LAATKVVVYIGSPGDSRRQTLLSYLFSIRLAIFLLRDFRLLKWTPKRELHNYKSVVLIFPRLYLFQVAHFLRRFGMAILAFFLFFAIGQF
jgi:hypothetical protein